MSEFLFQDKIIHNVSVQLTYEDPECLLYTTDNFLIGKVHAYHIKVTNKQYYVQYTVRKENPKFQGEVITITDAIGNLYMSNGLSLDEILERIDNAK